MKQVKIPTSSYKARWLKYTIAGQAIGIYKFQMGMISDALEEFG